MTDPLTKLPNRRYAMEHLNQEWASAERTGLPLACLMIDVDHFKRFNDEHSHEMGDRVLQEIAAVLRSTARISDLVSRWGGEEFMLVCSNTDADAAYKLAERLRLAVQDYTSSAPCKMHPTVSVGGGTRDPSMSDPADLLNVADRALLVAKRTGRNRVVLYRLE
jgi:diguanylate cyclase (GGDEF)-like protein